MRRRGQKGRFDLRRVTAPYVMAWAAWAAPIACAIVALALAIGWFSLATGGIADTVAAEEQELQSLTSEIQTLSGGSASGSLAPSATVVGESESSVDTERVVADERRGAAFLRAIYEWEGVEGRKKAKETLARDWGIKESYGTAYPPTLAGVVSSGELASHLAGTDTFLVTCQGAFYTYWSFVDVDTPSGRRQLCVEWKSDGETVTPLAYDSL